MIVSAALFQGVAWTWNKLSSSSLVRYAAAGVAVIGGLSYFHHSAVVKARKECRADVVQEQLQEVIRQKDVVSGALKRASERAFATEAKNAELESQVQAAIAASRNNSTAGKSVCLTKETTDALRKIK